MGDFFTFEELEKTNANYYIAYGERSAGKTTDFLTRVGLLNFLEYGKEFFIVRRTEEEITQTIASTFYRNSEYIRDFVQCNCLKYYPQFERFDIRAHRHQFILSGFNEDEQTDIGVIGYFNALSTAHKIKSTAFDNVTSLFYDEFISESGLEISKEFNRFQGLISTLKRKRTDFKIYMGGNTVDRNNSILYNMGIDIRDITQNQIKVFEYKTVIDNKEVKNSVAVQHTRHFQQSEESESYFIFNNQVEKMILGGEWVTDTYNNFNDTEFYNNTVTQCYIFENEYFRLYGYYSNGKLFVTDDRMYCDLPYTTLTTKGTHIKRHTYNYKCGLEPIERMKENLYKLYCNDYILYKNNLIGDDFTTFCNNIGLMI